MSIRISNLLGLCKPAPETVSSIEREHWKRIWWTSYCLDRMTSSDSGLESAYHGDSPELDHPNDISLLPEEMQEFSAAQYLTAQSKLCLVKRRIDWTASRLRSDDSRDFQEILEPSMELLEQWRSELPPDMSFTFEDGIPLAMAELPAMRSLASLYLRYHQVREVPPILFLFHIPASSKREKFK